MLLNNKAKKHTEPTEMLCQQSSRACKGPVQVLEICDEREETHEGNAETNEIEVMEISKSEIIETTKKEVRETSDDEVKSVIKIK